MTQNLLFPSWVKTCSWRNNRDRLPTWNFNLQNGNTKSVLSFSQKQTTKKESLHWFERDHLILYLQLMDEQTFWYLQDSRNINQYARLDSERDELARRKLTLDRRSKVGEGEEIRKTAWDGIWLPASLCPDSLGDEPDTGGFDEPFHQIRRRKP